MADSPNIVVTLPVPGGREKLYLEADHSDTCDLCGSASVIWLTGKSGKRYLAEIFEISDEHAVYCTSDFHSYYCTFNGITKKPLAETAAAKRKLAQNSRWEELRHRLNGKQPEQPTPDPEPTPEPEKPAEIKHDKLPYACGTCGNLVVNSEDGNTILNFNMEFDPHTCEKSAEDRPIRVARMRGTRVARRVKFVEISTRMESVERMMDDRDSASEEWAELAAEHLMLKKRLHQEIPG